MQKSIEKINLHKNDDSSAEMCTVSFGFMSALMPTSDGMTIDWNEVNSPKFNIIKSAAITASAYVFLNLNLIQLSIEKRKFNLKNLPVVKCDETIQMVSCCCCQCTSITECYNLEIVFLNLNLR